jgi:hypothetical protein
MDRFATVGRTCVRELLYIAVISGLSVVMLQQRIARDICSAAEQQLGSQGLDTACPAAEMGPYRELCSSIAPGPYRSLSWQGGLQVLASYPSRLVASALVSSSCYRSCGWTEG